jgi:2-polyprenyl-6-methoxyphenol hydroxylase-like FAD-dependent oxidoreductase
MACALAGLDVSVTLLEKDPLQEVGHVRRGEALRSEVCEVLAELGLMKYFEQQNAVIRRGERRELWHVLAGKLGEFRYDYLSPNHPVLHLTYPQIVAALYGRLAAAASVTAIFGAEVMEVGDYQNGRRQVVYRNRIDGSSKELAGDSVIVSDGGGSTLRRGLGIATEHLDYGAGYLMFYLQRPARMHWGRFYVGPEGFLGILPTPGDRVRAAVEVKTAALSDWLSASREEQQRRVVRRAPFLEGCALEDVGLFYHVAKRHASRYTLDGVCLIGDAAHTTHPMLGQGISMVFNDIRCLYRLLGAHPTGPFPASLLEHYEACARPFNTVVMENNHNLFHWLGRIGEESGYRQTVMQELQQMGFDAA